MFLGELLSMDTKGREIGDVLKLSARGQWKMVT